MVASLTSSVRLSSGSVPLLKGIVNKWLRSFMGAGRSRVRLEPGVGRVWVGATTMRARFFAGAIDDGGAGKVRHRFGAIFSKRMV